MDIITLVDDVLEGRRELTADMIPLFYKFQRFVRYGKAAAFERKIQNFEDKQLWNEMLETKFE